MFKNNVKKGSDSIDFNSIGKELKRVAPEYLKVLLPKLRLGCGKRKSLFLLVL